MTHLLLMFLLDLFALTVCLAACFLECREPPTVGFKPTVDAPTLPTVNDWRAVFGLEPLAF